MKNNTISKSIEDQSEARGLSAGEPIPLGIVRLNGEDGNIVEAWDGEIYEEAVMDRIGARILGNRHKARLRSGSEPAKS